jgi:surfactin synthase thioesterase subunit
MFCFPCAGSSAMNYLRWRRRLPDWVDILPVELPGRGKRISEAFVRDFDRLADQLTEELAGELPGNYVFFGHSLGGLLAHGCAHRLQKIGRPAPRTMFVACCAAPSKRKDLDLAAHSQDADLIKRLQDLNGTAPEVFEHAELLRLTLDAAAADFAVCASYRYVVQKPLDTTISVFGGRDDEIDESALAAWQKETSAPFWLDMFDGGHFFMKEHEDEFLSSIQEKLHFAMRRTQI